MEKIIVIQFRTDSSITQEQRCLERFIGKRNINYVNAFEENSIFTHPAGVGEFKAVILGGSGQFRISGSGGVLQTKLVTTIRKISPLIKFIINNDYPVLGICFGHQLLGYFLGAKVIGDPIQEETGSFLIRLSSQGRESFLYNNVPDEFIAQFGHKDSLEEIPSQSVILARSERCRIVSFQYKKNIFGVQFHPEMNLSDVKLKLKTYPDYKTPNIVFKESPYSGKVVENFLSHYLH